MNDRGAGSGPGPGEPEDRPGELNRAEEPHRAGEADRPGARPAAAPGGSAADAGPGGSGRVPGCDATLQELGEADSCGCGCGSGGEEEALRRLLRDVVEELEPTAGTLEHLRAAVPARRRRRRNLLLGAAASVALLGLGAPAALSSFAGQGEDARSSAALDSGAQRTTGNAGAEEELGGWLTGRPSGERIPAPADVPGAKGDRDGWPWPGDSTGEGFGNPDRETLGVASPTCDRSQLGQARTELEAPDAQGRIYGTIRLANVSADPCRVTGGELAALPLGRTGEPPEVQVVDRTEGDRATRLPAPDESLEELVLPPGEAYEVRFAWVPEGTVAGTCQVDGIPSSTDSGDGSPGPTGDPLAADADANSGAGLSPTGARVDGTEPTATSEPKAAETPGTSSASPSPSTPSPTPGDGTGDADGGGGDTGAGGDSGGGDADGGGTGGVVPGPVDADDDGVVGEDDEDGGGDGNADGGGAGNADGGGTGGGAGGGSGNANGGKGLDGGAGDEDDETVLLRYTPAAGEPEAVQIRLEGSCAGTIYRTGVLEAPAAQ